MKRPDQDVPKIPLKNADQQQLMLDIMTYAYLGRNPDKDLAHYNALGFFIDAADLIQLSKGNVPFQMFIPPSANAKQIRFRAGYKIYNPLNAEHRALKDAFEKENADPRAFFAANCFAAHLIYDEHVTPLLVLPEAIEE